MTTRVTKIWSTLESHWAEATCNPQSEGIREGRSVTSWRTFPRTHWGAIADDGALARNAC